MFRTRIRLAAVALVALVAACSEGSTGPKPHLPAAGVVAAAREDDPFSPHREVVVDTIIFQDGIHALPCGDGEYTEFMTMEGMIIVRAQTIRDAAGGLHYRTQSMPIGLRGVGQESGAEYRVTERESGVFNDNGMGQSSTYRVRLDWHAPSIGTRGSYLLTAHYTMNANGEIVREKSELRAACRD